VEEVCIVALKFTINLPASPAKDVARREMNVKISNPADGTTKSFVDTLAADAARIGVDGFIIPDLPIEESDDFRLPLAEAKIEVFEVPGRPGYYESRAYLRPHIQLEGVSINLGVVSRIPGGA